LDGRDETGSNMNKHPNEKRIAQLVRQLLVELGEDPDRDGLVKTPGRVAKSLAFLTQGYRRTPKSVLNGAVFDAGANHMIVLKDIEVYSMCEHHMLPFFGKCHVGYIPKKRIIGVSKIARIVDMFARRFQVQERMTKQIAHAVASILDAEGVGVVVEAQHLCMRMRGVEKQNSIMTTSSMLGSFRRELATRNEFTRLIR
jgi:GTP cyclohydrolase I